MTTDRRRARWDAMSEWFATNAGDAHDDDLLLTTIDELHLLAEPGTVLDIGCGAGRHLASLVSRTTNAVGLDLSPRMITRAREIAGEKLGARCDFFVHDWTEGAPAAVQGRTFDLVIANNTSAVNGPADLDRMLEHAHGYCVLAKPVHRSSLLLNEVLAGANRSQRTGAGSKALASLLGRLFELGHEPRLRYRSETWRPQLDREQFLASIAEFQTPADPDFRDRAEHVFDARSIDGRVEDSITARLALAVWDTR